MRVAVYGAGGTGGYIGGRLAQAGEEVALIARGQHLEAIRDRGLRIDSINGDGRKGREGGAPGRADDWHWGSKI